MARTVSCLPMAFEDERHWGVGMAILLIEKEGDQ